MHCEDVHRGPCLQSGLHLPSQYHLTAMELIRTENGALNQVDMMSLSAALEKIQFGSLIEAKAAARTSASLFAEKIDIWRLPPRRPEYEPNASTDNLEIIEVTEPTVFADELEIIGIVEPPKKAVSNRPRITIHPSSLQLRKGAPPASGLRQLDPTKYAQMVVALDKKFDFRKRGPSGVNTLTYEDFASMSYTQWVNDASVHEYLHLLCSPTERSAGPRFSYFDTFFSYGLEKNWTFSKLKSVTNKTRWSDKQTIFIPHNLNQSCKKTCQQHQPVGAIFFWLVQKFGKNHKKLGYYVYSSYHLHHGTLS